MKTTILPWLFSRPVHLGVLLGVVFLACLSGVLLPQPFAASQAFQSMLPAAKHLRTDGAIHTYNSQVRVLGIESHWYNPTPTPVAQKDGWGVARQIDEHTWTVKLADDERMATPQEIYTALNAYRQRQGKALLAWDNGLATFAQSRAHFFTQKGSTDKHVGFMNFLNQQDGFTKLGFNGVGENSSFGYKLLGVHIIEWMYAADSGHNDNQLNSAWTHVGIGVDGVATDVVFGGSKE